MRCPTLNEIGIVGCLFQPVTRSFPGVTRSFSLPWYQRRLALPGAFFIKLRAHEREWF